MRLQPVHHPVAGPERLVRAVPALIALVVAGLESRVQRAQLLGEVAHVLRVAALVEVNEGHVQHLVLARQVAEFVGRDRVAFPIFEGQFPLRPGRIERGVKRREIAVFRLVRGEVRAVFREPCSEVIPVEEIALRERVSQLPGQRLQPRLRVALEALEKFRGVGKRPRIEEADELRVAQQAIRGCRLHAGLGGARQRQHGANQQDRAAARSAPAAVSVSPNLHGKSP